jgi:cation diffusion facilitator CzcD-associated flavoprotein CzcO
MIVTPFGFASTADDVVDGLDLSGKQVIVTGGASAIGLEAARALANAGAEVTLAVRNLDSGEKAAADIGAAGVRVRRLDLADRASIGVFVAKWTDRSTFSSTMRASWPCPNYREHLRGSRCSSQRTFSVTLR